MRPPEAEGRTVEADGFVIESSAGGAALVVTGPWSERAAIALDSGKIQVLVLNYAHGFQEPDLTFLRPWPLRGLHLIGRHIRDLGPIRLLADTLEDLSLQSDRKAKLDLSGFTRLQHLAAPHVTVRDTLDRLPALRSMVLLAYTAADLTSLAVHRRLEELTLKQAAKLESVAGVETLGHLSSLWIQLAPRLRDVAALASCARSLQSLRLDLCRSLGRLDDLAALGELRFLELGNCGELASFAPLSGLARLEGLYAWGDTKALDGDLSPLRGLPLRELRMQARRSYRPSLAELKSELGLHA